MILLDYICYLIISASFVCHSNYTARGLFQVYLPLSFNRLHRITIWVSANWGLLLEQDPGGVDQGGVKSEFHLSPSKVWWVMIRPTCLREGREASVAGTQEFDVRSGWTLALTHTELLSFVGSRLYCNSICANMLGSSNLHARRELSSLIFSLL